MYCDVDECGLNYGPADETGQLRQTETHKIIFRLSVVKYASLLSYYRILSPSAAGGNIIAVVSRLQAIGFGFQYLGLPLSTIPLFRYESELTLRISSFSTCGILHTINRV